MALQNYPAVYGQSLYDICLQVYGTLDLLYKLLQDSGVDSVNVVPFSGQVFIYDDTLVTDQAIINRNVLGNILYATDIGSNGSVYYMLHQGNPRLIHRKIPGGPGIPVSPPVIITDMAVYATSYVSSADGTTDIFPLDINGNSMSGSKWDIVQIEQEIKPLANTQYVWNTALGKISLLGGLTLDNGQSIFIIYSQPRP